MRDIPIRPYFEPENHKRMRYQIIWLFNVGSMTAVGAAGIWLSSIPLVLIGLVFGVGFTCALDCRDINS